MKTIWKVLLGVFAFILFVGVLAGLVFGIISMVQYQKMATRLTDFEESKVQEPVVEEPVEEPVVVVTGCEQYTMDLGSIGAYYGVYDWNEEACTVGIWETSALRKGIGLAESKLQAFSVTFSMPFDGEVNNSAGHISINGVEWVLGNPAQSPDGETIVNEGDSVTIWTDGPNDSAGFELWQKK